MVLTRLAITQNINDFLHGILQQPHLILNLQNYKDTLMKNVSKSWMPPPVLFLLIVILTIVRFSTGYPFNTKCFGLVATEFSSLSNSRLYGLWLSGSPSEWGWHGKSFQCCLRYLPLSTKLFGTWDNWGNHDSDVCFLFCIEERIWIWIRFEQ